MVYATLTLARSPLSDYADFRSPLSDYVNAGPFKTASKRDRFPTLNKSYSVSLPIGPA